jgi:putative ABC transport system permease protein
MKALWVLWARVTGLFRKSWRERELVEEFESHLQMHMDDNIRGGMSPEQARREALLKFGGVEAAKEGVRETSRLAWLETTCHDLQYAVRQFRGSPGFTFTAVLTLALGIGATTAIFSLVNGILLRPLAYREPNQLVAIDTIVFPPGVAATNLAAATYTGSSYPDYFDWQRKNRTFASLASYDEVSRLFSKPDGEGARVMRGGRVSANLFSTLGVAPAMGRTFMAEEEQPGHRVVILSHELWVSDFASSTHVLGQTVKISDEPSTIVGVMPAGFHYPPNEPALFWATFAADNEGPVPNTSVRHWERLSIIGRLKAGVGLEQALADLNAIQSGVAQHYSEDRFKLVVSVTALLEDLVYDVRPILTLLMAAVGVVLIIGCTNVAGLLLARSSRRRPELALRTALGASQTRILRQLLLESLLLALGGGVVGILMSYILLRAGLRFVPSRLPRLYDVAMDERVLAFAILLSAATSLIFGLLPAWRMSRLDPAHALRESGTTITSGRQRNRLHHALVVAETALGFTLLIGSGLLIRSTINLLVIEPGFDTKHTVIFDIALTQKRYPDPSKVPFYEKLLPQLRALPGVEMASSGHPLPLNWPRSSWANFTIPGHPYSPDDLPGAMNAAVEPEYFETLSIPLLQGRTFTGHDNDSKSPAVAVINQSFANRYFPGENPIGRYFIPNLEHPGEAIVGRQIIGIVGDTRTGSVLDPYQPGFFLPYAQDPTHQRTIVVLRVAGDPHSYENAVRKIVAGMDKDSPVFGYGTFTERIDTQAAQPRFEATLVSGFAAIALLLAAVGLYSVLSYIVAERTRELGLRMALGASRKHVLRLVLQRGFTLACIGVGAGVLASLFATRLIADTLFKVAPLDRSVYLIVTLALLAVSILAALGPAVRAAKVDPMRALREQ